MNPDDLKNFKPLLIQTADQHLLNVKKLLESLSQDMENKDAVKNLHIAYHSLKGEFFMVGLMSTGSLCLKLELLFKKIQEKPDLLNSLSLATVIDQTEVIRNSLDNFQNDVEEIDLTENVKIIDRIINNN